MRTKHLTYAYRILEETLDRKHYETWDQCIALLVDILSEPNTSLKGAYWLLNGIVLVDAIPHKRELFDPVLEPFLSRCRKEGADNEWAAGCAFKIFELFKYSIEDILNEKELLLSWLTMGSGRAARFGRDFANHLINKSNYHEIPDEENPIKILFDEVDVDILVGLANSLPLDNFYSFGSLLGRLSFFNPSWGELFLGKLDWSRSLKIILEASPDEAYGVDKLVGSFTLIDKTNLDELNLQFIKDITPYIIRSIEEDPVNTIQSMHDIFWSCLRFSPHFLRGGRGPNSSQLALAQKIVSSIEPRKFSATMANVVSRDMENLARTLSFLNEVDSSFTKKVAKDIPTEEFLASTKKDWEEQSKELHHLIRFFCFEDENLPAKEWVVRNEDTIKGPLRPIFAAISPSTAIKFHKNQKGIKLIDEQIHWHETALAIHNIGKEDEKVCTEIVSEQLNHLINALYKLTLDPPGHLVNLFGVIHSLSEDIYASLINGIDINSEKAQETINRLGKNQPNERKNYIKLAKLAIRIGGVTGKLGKELLLSLERYK